jgi:hypothetical protein
MTWLLIAAAALAVLVALSVVVLLVVTLRRTVSPERARDEFRRQREHLEADFFRAAAASGKPRGLRWKACEWDDTVELARDKKTGQVLAFAGVTVSFEAIEGGDMEGLPAVGNLRNATAVFVHDGGRWQTAGRTLFNLNPDEAIRHFGERYERVGV